MIYIDGFTARLGNQLFQLAAAIGLAKKYNNQVAFPDWNRRHYFAGDFTPYTGDKIIDAIWMAENFEYGDIDHVENMAINGYFQSEKYFIHCRKYIKNVFKVNHIDSKYEIEPNSCSIHVRRGDYCNLQHFHPLKTWNNYYSHAYGIMEGYSPNKYYIFSDNIDMVKSDFPDNSKFVYVDGNDEMTDFYLMTKCKYSIIGNSSYSWWTAWLKEQEGQVIAPTEWFGPAYAHYNTKDLIPTSWKTV